MPLYVRLRALTERYRVAVVRTMLVLAAATVAVGWEVEPVKKAFVDSGALSLVLLALIIDISITLSHVISTDYRLRACRDDTENERMLNQYILKHSPKKVDLLEYSAHSMHYLIEELAKKGATIRILIRDPRVVGDFQRNRILASIVHIERFAIRPYNADIEIRCYRAAPTLRGRQFDDSFLTAGWYTPDISSGGTYDEMEVMGHRNPMVMCSTATDDGQHLKKFFDEVFSSLWASAEENRAVDILKVYNSQK